MNGPHDKLDFVPDPSTLTGSEDLMARRIEEDSILEYREEEVREAAHKKLWTQVTTYFVICFVIHFQDISIILSIISLDYVIIFIYFFHHFLVSRFLKLFLNISIIF